MIALAAVVTLYPKMKNIRFTLWIHTINTLVEQTQSGTCFNVNITYMLGWKTT